MKGFKIKGKIEDSKLVDIGKKFDIDVKVLFEKISEKKEKVKVCKKIFNYWVDEATTAYKMEMAAKEMKNLIFVKLKEVCDDADTRQISFTKAAEQVCLYFYNFIIYILYFIYVFIGWG